MKANRTETNSNISVLRKRIKNLYIRIYPDGSAVVSAPLYLSDNHVQEFIDSKLQWIREKQSQQIQRQSQQQSVSTNNNRPEWFQLWGETYPLHYQRGGRNSFDFIDNVGVVTLRNNAAENKTNDLISEFYRDALTVQLNHHVDNYQPIIGVDVHEIRTKRMKTRWGTCNIRAKRLWFNVFLAQFPRSCTEYVVVHEMTHLHERYHNHRFYRLVGEAMPEWKKWHQHLRNVNLTPLL